MTLKPYLLFLSCLFVFQTTMAQEFNDRMSPGMETTLLMIDDPGIRNAKDLIQAMQRQNRNRWFKSFTFVQETIRFNKDGSPRDTAVWYEAIAYPDRFRIDTAHPSKGNAHVYRRDSAYHFKEGTLIDSKYDPKQFLLMKGGLYHYETDEVVQKLEAYGYNTSEFHASEWEGRPIWILGAEAGDLRSPQFWLDAEHFYLVRRISTLNDGRQLDVQYSDHIQSNGGWVEQIVKFFVDGRYVQLEYYKEIDTAPQLPEGLFDPQQFGKSHWYDAH